MALEFERFDDTSYDDGGAPPKEVLVRATPPGQYAVVSGALRALWTHLGSNEDRTLIAPGGTLDTLINDFDGIIEDSRGQLGDEVVISANEANLVAAGLRLQIDQNGAASRAAGPGPDATTEKAVDLYDAAVQLHNLGFGEDPGVLQIT